MNQYPGHGLTREPFSSSPDPNFLVDTHQHATCLQELEISLRLRRGINVVTGDIGTGKTTLCRGLLRAFAGDDDADVHLLLDPHFETSEEFLRVILTSVSGVSPEPGMGLWALKEALKQQLFRLGLVEKRLVILVIDEAQKISPDNLEILREMLNYETNTAKLLQIVLFGQRELEPMLEAMPNLLDRVNVRRRLRPLRLAETAAMIRHRLRVAAGDAEPPFSFSTPAVLAIHSASGGSPRKTVRLCHLAMIEMFVRGLSRVDLSCARAAIRPDHHHGLRLTRRGAGLAAACALCLVMGGLWFSLGGGGPVLGGPGVQQPFAGPSHQPNADKATFQTGQEATPAPARDTAAAAVPAREAEARATELSAEGVTLRPEEDMQESRPVMGVSLLPQRDQGPALRNRIETAAPSRLHASLPEPTLMRAAYSAESR